MTIAIRKSNDRNPRVEAVVLSVSKQFPGADHVTEITLDHLRPSPEWKKQIAELQLAEECEAEIRAKLKVQAKREAAKAAQLQMLNEVAEVFQTPGGDV